MTAAEAHPARASDTPAESDGARWLVRLVLSIALLLHAALLAYFVPRKLVFSGLPFHTFDYSLHVYQVDRALAAFRTTGHLWSYDPMLLAGQPAGAVEDLTSKSVELFVIAANRWGVRPWVAFNVYVLLVHAAMPAGAWISARLFRLSRLAAAVTVLFWVILWHFDSFVHWCWYVGMISWAAASVLSVLVVALMYRALADHRPGTYAWLGATATLVTLVHPFAVLTLAVPLSALYARSFRRGSSPLSPWEHLALAAGTVAAAATTLTWIGPALRFRHYIGPVDAFLWPTLSYVVFDWFDLLKDVLMTGQPVRTAFRVLAFGLAAVELRRLHRARDDRFLPLAALIGSCVFMAYVSGYSSALRQTQPYRHLAPAVLASAIAGATPLLDSLSPRCFVALDRSARSALAVAAALALPAFARTVLGYLPSALPDRGSPRTALRPGPVPGTSNDEPPLPVLGHQGPSDDYRALGRFLDRAFAGGGRVAVIDWPLGEYLPVFTRVPVLGGIPQRNIPHVAAHPARHDSTPRAPGDDPFRRYLDEYAVSAVVVGGEPGPLDTRRDVLAPAERFGALRVYRVVAPSSYFATGQGKLVAQELNSLRFEDVRAGDGDDVVLRFHWLETLRCRPGCEVRRVEADGDQAGFLGVRHPPSTFEIYNGY